MPRLKFCSSHQLGLEVERRQRSMTFSCFACLHDKRNNFSFYAIFSACLTEPAAMFKMFPTRDIVTRL